MNQFFFALFICLILHLSFSTNAMSFDNNLDAYPFTTTDQSERFHFLLQEIRCVVCQNQNIADSNAPLAVDLRKKIYLMVNKNKSNQEIKNYLVSRYGEFILLNPRMTQHTFILWILPVVGIALILLALFYKYHRQKS